MSTAWTDGYQTEVNYTYGYYRDLSPTYQKFCLLLNGVDCAEDDENHQHCELGFGQGVSLNVHAATSLGGFYGTDFNPAHAAHANMLAEHSNTAHAFYDDSFEELLHKDLPMFDSISLHGIWSWISHENQHIILKFIRKFLKPNGVVYISYNCLTGWAANMPIRELFHSHFNFNSTSSNPLQKVADALNFSESLLSKQPIFALRNPNALQKVLDLKKQNPNYLIHEYLNQDWQCFSFQQIVRILENIKLSYAGSTDLNIHLDSINFSAEHQAFLNQIEHPVFKEQCRDYFANTQFRRDLFIRGKNQLSPLQVQQRLRKTRFVLLTAAHELPNSIHGSLGEFNLIPEIYTPLGAYFKSQDYQAQSIGDLEQALPELSFSQLLNALMILCHLGMAQPCQHHSNPKTLEQAHKLNQFILKQASYHTNYQVLACPITGMGIPCNQIRLLFYRAHFQDQIATDASAYAHYVQQVLNDLSWHLLDEQGQNITDQDKSLASLTMMAQRFIEGELLKIAQQLQLFSK